MNESRKIAERKARNYAYSEVHYMRQRDLDDYYSGSKSIAEEKIYEKKIEEYTIEETWHIQRKLGDALDQLEIEKKRELDDNIRKKTNDILSNAKDNLRSRLKTDYDVCTVGFIDLEKLVNMNSEDATTYISWITGELAGKEIEQADGSFVENFNRLYEQNRAVATVVCAQKGFFKKYVQNISDIHNPSTVEFLYDANYTGDFPTEEMSKKYIYEIQVLEQRRQIEALEARISEQEAVIVNFEKCRENDRASLNECNKIIKSKDEEIGEKNKKIESQEEKIGKLEQNIEDSNAELEEKNQKINDLTELSESQAETIKTQEEQIRAITEQNEALLKKIEVLENEKKSQTERASALEQKVARQDDIIAKDSRIIEKLRKSVSSLQGIVQNYCNIVNTIKGYIVDLYNKTEAHNSNIKAEKQKGFFTKLKEKLFSSKKNVSIEEESNEILGECNCYLVNTDTYYAAMKQECCNIGSYQIEDSIIEERSKRIRQANGDSELTFESVNKNYVK